MLPCARRISAGCSSIACAIWATFPNKAAWCRNLTIPQPEDILNAFLSYYQTAKLDDVADPNLIFDLNEKLRASGIFQWTEVEQFCTAFFQKSKSNAALANICKPAVQRWQIRYKAAMLAYQQTRDLLERTQKTGDAVLIANADNSFKAAKKEKDALEIFKKDLGTFVRFYEFMSQIVDYDDTSLEKLSLYARHLSPLLREQLLDEDDIDLNHIVLSHYRLSKIKQQDLLLNEDQTPYGLKPGEGMGTAKARDPKEEFLSQIIARLNEIFITDSLTDGDQVKAICRAARGNAVSRLDPMAQPIKRRL
jgi:type I restriction enzyme, R subunit